MKVVGADGCKGDWVAMVWDVEQASIEPEIHKTLAGLIDHHADAGAIGIDIPIGLSSTGTRRCDVEARRKLGKDRRSNVFPPPVYEILDVPTFEETQRRSVAAIGRGTSQRTFANFDKIKEATDAAAGHGIALEVIKLPEAKRGFVLLPQRWVVERDFAWATRFRRLVRDRL